MACINEMTCQESGLQPAEQCKSCFLSEAVTVITPWRSVFHVTKAQILAIAMMCIRNHVPMDINTFLPDSSLPQGYVSGWIGSVYYGIAPDGSMSS